MGKRIHGLSAGLPLNCGPLMISPDYFVSLGLDDGAASKLHLEYYIKYGLALRGLTSNHQIGEVPVS